MVRLLFLYTNLLISLSLFFWKSEKWNWSAHPSIPIENVNLHPWVLCLFLNLQICNSWPLHRFIWCSHPQACFSILFFFARLYLRFLHACLWVNWQGWIILNNDNGELFQLYSCFFRTSRIFLNTWIKKLV